jgi:hypothetical protein
MDTTDKPLINRVAQSSLITLNLEDYYPKTEILSFDLKDFLFHGLILKEKEFRSALADYDWQKVKDCYVAIFCSSDAIIPTWAYMLVAAYAAPLATEVYFGSQESLLEKHYGVLIGSLDLSHLKGQRIVLKGCSNKPVPPSAYVDLTKKLLPLAQSIMFGEPCSTVPIFKRPRDLQTKT